MLEHYQERFRYILVDEYQDTNRAQYQLVNLLAAKYRNVCVVGDADQGVYSWRGATIQNLLDFEHDYPDAEVFLMEQNYRSTQNILAVANALIEHNVQRKPKSLWTETTEGELAVRFRADNEHEEALFVAEEIAPARRGRGAPVLATSRSSTGRTPRAGCSRTSSCGRASRTASSAACGSTSARRSRTSSPTCGCW